MPRKGQTKYKGMFQEGHKFGQWTLLDPEPIRTPIIKESPKGKNKTTYKYKCECGGCGKTQEVDCYTLEKGKSTCCNDCGQGKNKGSSNPSWKGYKGLPSSYLTRIKAGAKQRGYCFEITMEDAWKQWEKQGGLCALSGQKISICTKNNGSPDKASLDRIDPKQGYTPDNIQWLHKDINFMKRNFPEDYLIEMCKKIIDHQKSA